MTRAHVEYRERDLSSYVRVGDSIYAAFVVASLRGEVNVPVLTGGRDNFLKRYTKNGKVPVGASTSYYSVLAAFKGGNNIITVRAASATAMYAGSLVSDSPTGLGSLDPAAVEFGTASFYLTSADQGTWGNDLVYTLHGYKADAEVVVGESILTPPADQTWTSGFPVRLMGAVPTELSVSSVYYVKKVDATLELYSDKALTNKVTFTAPASGVTILAAANNYTTIPGTARLNIYRKTNLNDPIESFIVSKTSETYEGISYYMEDVTKNSINVKIVDNEFVATIPDVLTPQALSGGSDGDAITTADMLRALNSLKNKKRWSNIKVVGDSGWAVPAYQQAIKDLAEGRQDLVAITSSPLSAQANEETAAAEVVQFRKVEQNINSSYAALYAPHLEIYDEFNDREIFVAPDGFAAAAILQTASNFEIWYPVAGNTRGVVSALDTKVHFNEEDQNFLYDNGVNPIIFEEGEGIKIWGQKTLQSQASMLDRLNVRLLLVTLGPAITKFLEGTLFEFNDTDTRADVKAKIDRYMDSVLARKGVTSFVTVCDETNNSQSDIDNHILNVDLIICPSQSVEKINFTVALTSEGSVSLNAQAA